MNKKKYSSVLKGIAILIFGMVIGWFLFSAPVHEDTATVHEHTSATVWTCSMHPDVRQPGPGRCPICGMHLIPLETAGDDSFIQVRMSDEAMKLANIQTTIVGMGALRKEVRLRGTVQTDERRVSSQAAHVPGRIEQLVVNFTGEYVRKGAVLAYVYSPELVTVRQELREAYAMLETQPALYEAARAKLKAWKLDDAQIDAILTGQHASDRFPVTADVSGIVIARNVSVGDYVARGASLYEIADLSRVWVHFDVYESDMSWVTKGDTVVFTVSSFPGQEFTGTITFVDPLLDPQTRVAAARVELSNPSFVLKPGMFVSGVIRSGMEGSDELVVPRSAVMWTGVRSVVYIKVSSGDGVAFEMREVVLGPALGDRYIIKEGLKPGEEVVTNGTFTVDAAAQLEGKASMMGGRSHQ